MSIEGTVGDWASWQKSGQEFVEACEASLWGKDGTGAMNYLRMLGLQEEALQKYRIGFFPGDSDKDDTAGQASLQHMNNSDKDKSDAARLPRGIVVPCFAEKNLWYIKILRPHKGKRRGQPVSFKVKGSKAGIFGVENLGKNSIALLTENELEAMIIEQHVGDLISIATLGNPSERIRDLDLATWGHYLLHLKKIFVAYQQDSLGKRGIAELRSFSPRFLFTPIPLVQSESQGRVSYKIDDLRSWAEDLCRGKIMEKGGGEEKTSLANQSQEKRHELLDIRDWMNQPWRIDPTIPCFACGQMNYQEHPDGGTYFCATCHPSHRLTSGV